MDSSVTTTGQRRWRWLGFACVLIAAVVLLVFFWDWDWFRPLVEARLSSAVGRSVTIERLEVHPGRVTRISVYGVKAANPSGFDGPQSAAIERVAVTVEVETWLRSRRIVIPLIELDQPDIFYQQNKAGKSNWDIAGSDSSSPAPEIGNLQVQAGVAHVHMEDEQADATINIATQGDAVVLEGKGTYARQPIVVKASGGALLALRDAATPYPVDLQLDNGSTRITLKGHISDPLNLKGADLNLVLAGPNMELLLPLIGIATPKTPPYKISGRLDFENGRIKFTDMTGLVGSSDLSGDLEVNPAGQRPTLTANLVSHRVDMEDLGGFVGSTPGRTTTPGQTPQQVEEVKRAEASPKLLPTTRISIPKVLAADVHLTYHGEKILGKNMPFDSINVKMDIEAGRIRLAPIRLGIGDGALAGTISLSPVGDVVDADADIKAEHVNISKLLASAGLGSGQGTLDGNAKLKGRGASMSAILAHGDGGIRIVMPMGGNINSLLVDLSGLEIGPAFLAAIGVPDKEGIRCMVADFALQKGILASRTLEVNTTDHVITGGGRVDLSREVVEMTLRTDPKHFTIGKLATPIQIIGPFKDLHFMPDKELAIRGGLAAGLGALFPPAALLPTIQFGVGENSPCVERK
jgi:AsmA family protein